MKSLVKPQPGKLVHVLSVGERNGEYLLTLRRRFPWKTLVAADPWYREPKGLVSGIALAQAGVEVYANKADAALALLASEGRRVKEVRVNMPEAHFSERPRYREAIARYGLEGFFGAAKKVLEPDGKIVVRSEFGDLLLKLHQMAVENGFKARLTAPLGERQADFTESARAAARQDFSIHGLEITLPRRKKLAEPKAEKRVLNRTPWRNRRK